MMTNDDLEKKIVDIVLNVAWEGCLGNTYHFSGGISAANAIADALIEAGFVDKSDYASMKETAVKYKAEVSKAESRAKEAERRAKVLERALYILAKDLVDMKGYERWDIPVLAKEIVVPDYIELAEKELAEEQGNGNETA